VPRRSWGWLRTWTIPATSPASWLVCCWASYGSSTRVWSRSETPRRWAAWCAKSSLGAAKSSMGDAKKSLGDATSSLGDAESSLGDAESFLGDAESSLGDVYRCARALGRSRPTSGC
jgi:hypothetical protein